MESVAIPHHRRRFVEALFTSAALLSSVPAIPMQAQITHPQPVHFAAQPANTQSAKPSAILPTPAAPAAETATSSSLLQQPPTQAVIDATPGTLRINASNASLTQTLQRISEKTGMQVDGVTGDERVFGTFGPGDPRDVLSTLLDGTSYNMIMVGMLANGAPRELLLSQKSTAPTTPGQAQPQPSQPAIEDDNPDPPVDDSQQVIPPPGRPMGGPARNPQDLLQQMRQQQLQNQQNQQGQPQ